MPHNGLRLITLGRLGLIGSSGEADPSLSARRRKLAVLAVLALARRPLSRDQLTEMFWGGQPEDRARHSLSNALSHLRRVLGRDVISAHGTEVELLAEDRLEVDALEFAEAIARRDDERAAAIYVGPFLAGVYVDGSPTFEQWVAGERHRLEGLFLQACARYCHALARARRWDDCAALARRWLDTAPVSADAALYLLNALKAPGTREAQQRALAEYGRLQERLIREYELRPDKSVAALARELAEQVAAAGVEPGMTAEFALPATALVGRERSDSPSESAVSSSLSTQLQGALESGYAIDRELGRGAMAVVYLARDLKHDRWVALKVLRHEFAASLLAERFLREIRIAARLSHPHILPLHDSGEAGGLLYYVMPFVEGESLRQRLTREKALPIDAAIRITADVAAALDYAHRRGIVHRDIKPENILLADGHAIVADFGLARAVAYATDDTITQSGLAVGTPAYISPEQAAGESEVDGRSDIYSLGCVLYEMLAGEAPFKGLGAQAVIARRFSDPAPSIRAVRPDVGPALDYVDDVIARALAREPADRFETAAGLVTALDRAARSIRDADVGAKAPAAKASGPSAPPRSAEASAPTRSDGVASPVRAAVEKPPEPAPAPSSVRAPAPVPRFSRRAKRRMARALPLAAGLTLAGAAIGAAVVRPHLPWHSRAAAASGPPVIAIIDVGFLGSDTTNAWVTEGLPQMVAAKLGRAHAVEVIRPERVREVRTRAELPPGVPVPAERALELARRLGATWAVTGAMLDADTALQLDLTIRDVRTGEPVRRMELRAGNLLALADAAATRLLDAAGSTRQGPQLADIGTPNVEAYEQYIRYLQLESERRDAAIQALDSAVALDSGFISALRARMEVARQAGDRPVMARLDAAFQRAAYRATDWDRLSIAAAEAYRSGNWARTEAAARALVERFPRDPRAYQWMTHVYHMQGRWDDAERAATTQLGLDSLASAAGRGPCVPCAAYYDAAHFRMGARGDLPGAERLLRRLVELQPEMPNAWSTLAMALALQGRFDDAIAAVRRAVVLSGRSEPYRSEVVRILLMARRYDTADSALRAMAADTSGRVRSGASELRYLLERERGRFRSSIATIDALVRDDPGARDFLLARAEAIARTGDYAGARRAFEQFAHAGRNVGGFAAPDLQPLHTAESARTFTWAHSLMADAIAPAGDTVLLRVLADSIQQIGELSYYGRDRRLHHHVRGLISARAGRWEEAERHFRAARWGAFMWTRTLIEEAKAQLARGRPADAVATLRQTYGVPLDAMGRYVPRSELDYWMALAFRRAGRADSAAVYAAHVQRAWRDADPPVRQMMRALE